MESYRDNRTGVVVTPKVDPEMVRQVFNSMTNLHFMPVSDEQLMAKPNTVIVAGNGIFMHKRLPLADMTFKVVETDHFKGVLPKVASTVDVHVPLLPWATLLQVIAFFKEVNTKLKAEAYCQCLYLPGSDRWAVHVPEQEVTGGSVEHKGQRGDRLCTFDGREQTALHVWDIHSHGSMSPFFSTGDDQDEGRSHRFYGVIGKLDEAMPKMKIRIGDGQGKFLEPALHHLIELPEVQTVEVNALSMLTETPEVNLPLDTANVPLEWMLALSSPRAQFTTMEMGGYDPLVEGWDSHGGYAGRQHYNGFSRDAGGRFLSGYNHQGYEVRDNRRFAGLNPEPRETRQPSGDDHTKRHNNDDC